MAKTIINQKRDALKALPREELIDRICHFSDRELLNAGKYPLADMATQIRNDDYRMTENQYYTLIHNFARVTIAEVDRPMWVSDPNVFRMKPFPRTEESRFPADFKLIPNGDRVDVGLPNIAGNPMILGSLPPKLLERHPILDMMDAPGQMVITRIGDAVKFSYQMSLDLELLDAKADEVKAERLAAMNIPGQMHVSDYLTESLTLTETDLMFHDETSQLQC